MTNSELKERRERLRITQLQLANLLGVKENSVYRWESGKIPISKLVELAFENIETKLKNNSISLDKPT
jgi:transcriptional regulator with XRE-family HTH domain